MISQYVLGGFCFFFSTRQKQGDINGSVKRASTLASRIVPVVASAATVISSSRPIAQRLGEWTSHEGDGLGQIDISAAAMGHVYPQFKPAL
jgi:hypothetical protein